MHAISHISRAVAATDSCFALTGALQRGKAVRLMNGENPCFRKTPYRRGECKAVYKVPAPHNTCGSCWLGTAQQFYHDMRGEGGSQVTSKLKQVEHIHQPRPGHYLTHADSSKTSTATSAFCRHSKLHYYGLTSFMSLKIFFRAIPCFLESVFLPLFLSGVSCIFLSSNVIFCLRSTIRIKNLDYKPVVFLA